MAGHHAHAHATDEFKAVPHVSHGSYSYSCTTTARLLKLLSLVAPLQSRFRPSELKSPNSNRPENTFGMQKGRAARLPLAAKNMSKP